MLRIFYVKNIGGYIMEKTQKMNKMGTEKISRLLLTMGVPMIISMVVQAVYNIVDSYFVS